MKQPSWNLLTDTTQRYVPSHATDIRETFKRARKQMLQQPDAIANVELDVPVPVYEVKALPGAVYPIKRRKG